MSLSGFSGAAGIKYGLNVRGPKKPAGALPRPTLAAFAAPSDDEGDDDDAGDGRAGANAQIARQQQRARDSQKAQEVYAAALAQDANVFDYDGVYDDMKAAAKGPSAVEKARGQSRYIGQLLVKAQEREREADVVFERRTVKEREKEDHLYGDKEKFVTAAYKKKLEADAAFAAAERAADAAEAAADVSKRRDMSAFYANLLTKNTAYGAETQAAPAARPAVPPAAAAERPGAAASRGAPPSLPHAALRSPARSPSPEAEQAPRPPPPSPPQEALPNRVGPRGPEADAPPSAADAPQAPAAEDAAAAAAAKRARASEDAVASARERFLARKRARGAEDEG